MRTDCPIRLAREARRIRRVDLLRLATETYGQIPGFAHIRNLERWENGLYRINPEILALLAPILGRSPESLSAEYEAWWDAIHGKSVQVYRRMQTLVLPQVDTQRVESLTAKLQEAEARRPMFDDGDDAPVPATMRALEFVDGI